MRGAIQVSIGFLIVMVISALVMIFMMGWLGNMFPQLTKITEYATQQAEDQMMNEFAEGSDTILATIPSQDTFAPEQLVPFKIGVRKTGEVDDSDIFTICIGKLTGSSCKMSGEDQGNELAYVSKDIDIGFYIPRTVRITERNDIRLSDARMQIGEVKAGLYGFRLYVCPHDTDDDSTPIDDLQCTGLEDSYGTYTFIVKID